MNQQTKDYIREQVKVGPPQPPLRKALNALDTPDAAEPIAIIPDEHLIVNVMGSKGSASITLRPSEISRIRGRFGRGPNFEQWVADRVRDMIITFGGG